MYSAKLYRSYSLVTPAQIGCGCAVFADVLLLCGIHVLITLEVL